jgi:hypothetical protein
MVVELREVVCNFFVMMLRTITKKLEGNEILN